MPEGQTPPQEPEEETLEEESLDSPDTGSASPKEASAPEPKEEDKAPANEVTSGKASEPKKPKSGRRGIMDNLYLYIYVLVVIAAGLIVAVAFMYNKSPKTKKVTTKSLTSQQLAQLQGPTTIVGDSKQTLDIQSNTVFEGAILARSNLDVAGTLKVGGPLSIPSLNVSGPGIFGPLQVNQTLGVAGDVTLQGQVSLQKNLNVQGSASIAGSLSAGTLSVSNLQLNGDLTLSRHLIGAGGVPGRTNGTALGSGGTSNIGGSDSAGTVTISTGTSPPAGCFTTVNFAQKYASTPHVVISASNSSAGSLDYYTNRSNTGFSICTASTPTASTTYVFDYVVIQ